MLKNTTGIKLQGANFEEETVLQIFSGTHFPTVGMIYGKNGAGKSTISRAFSKIKGREEESIVTTELIDKDGGRIDITDDEKAKIHIFNEDYIDNNIRIREEGLETIVVLGKRKDLEDQIKDAKGVVDKKQNEINKQQEIYDIFLDASNASSPEFLENEMISLLKGEQNWAGRDSKIKGTSRASSVKTNAYEKFINIKPTKTRDILIIEFAKKLEELADARSGAKKIIKEVKIISPFVYDEDYYINLLAEVIEKPILSDREKYLLSLSATKGHDYINSIRTFFNNENAKRCPFCLQDVDDKYKEKLFHNIETILSKEAEKHQNELRKVCLSKIEFDFEPFSELDDNLLNKCRINIEKINDIIDEINQKVNEKCNDVYTPIVLEKKNIQQQYKELENVFEELEKSRNEYNKKASEVESRIDELNKINSEIAYYDIELKYAEYKTCLINKNNAKNVLDKLHTEMIPLQRKLQDLLDEKKNAKIALEKINDGLRYIFFANNRLSIEYHDDKYFLKSRGKAVSPQKISVGERNAIALCYFFSEIMKNRDEENVCDEQYCLIIDDPVSSFDMENRVGIMSYLKYQLQRFLNGNDRTKILLLTHDLQTAFDIEKIYKEIVVASGGKESNKYIKLYELINNELNIITVRDKNEYTDIMVNVYKYACGENANYELVVGNSMRRMLEAFSTFNYKKGIGSVSTDKNVIKNIPEPFTTYFENLMYRFVLNGGSHTEEKVKSMIDINFFDYISSAEKMRTAKEILCFLYLLNDVHVKEHLKGQANMEENIENWLKEIRERCI